MAGASAAAGRTKSVAVTRLVIAQISAVAVWAAVHGATGRMWPAVAAGALVAAALIIPVRGVDAITFASTLVRYRFGRRGHEAVLRDFPQPAGRPIGLSWDAPYVTAVVEVVSRPGQVMRLGRDSVEAEVTLPLDAIASCLRRHDVTLDGIDVVTHGWRVRDSSPAGQVYAHLLGPLPAAAERTVWLALRLDVSTCGEAIARRGGGAEGAARTVAAAARRVVRVLDEGGCAGIILSASDIENASRRVAHGVAPAEFARHPHHVPLPMGFNSGGYFDPRRFGRRAATSVWTYPALSSTLVVRLRPGDHGAVRVAGSARFTTRSPVVPALPGLRCPYGLDRESLTAALPVAAPRLEHVAPLRDVSAGELDGLALPPGGCGQLIGSDDAGRAVTVRLFGPGIRSVHVAGELYLAQQVVFRAVAVGARVLLYTDRVGAWRPLLDGAAGPDRLRVAGEYADDRKFDTVVYDGVRPTTVPPQVSAIHVQMHPDSLPGERPTVLLHQPGASGDRILLTTAGTRVRLTLVTIAAETTHIGRPRSPEPVPVS
ncbi:MULTISPECIES: type VII secretion protein EccE [unclassified Rhodococcus (in: high G+C Gram-positive bacteria)]|uniref:type VII secretion protein EccE n=1 Tax=unclassified Rhodococcus (in: high G+C Gram-positive bacteria) TaxID=192944 RepID=UPI00146A960B|nr:MULTISPECIES: type VII secretion protein EccE [unclassified Rhodococcus (in: high G+C Gram-positive bacteria)]NMD94641.1 type VII secretion protein EccE [Rhodococcus sp. BL-253-APC-6A1W]NME78231.1 type VII secretion protein EccE [Rhodococcus sp. 105337]